MAEQRIAQGLAVEHAAGDEGAGDLPVVRAQQHPDLNDSAQAVHAYRHRFDIEQGEATAGLGEFLFGQPAGVRVGSAY